MIWSNLQTDMIEDHLGFGVMSSKKLTNGETTNPLVFNGPAGGTMTFTEGEMRIMVAVVSLLDTKPTVSWQAVADMVGSASSGAASKRFSMLVAKHGLYNTSDAGRPAAAASGTGASAAKKPRDKGNSGKRKDNGGLGAADESPTKKPKAMAAGNAEVGSNMSDVSPIVKGKTDEDHI
jgi:hypothetical protein